MTLSIVYVTAKVYCYKSIKVRQLHCLALSRSPSGARENVHSILFYLKYHFLFSIQYY